MSTGAAPTTMYDDCNYKVRVIMLNYAILPVLLFFVCFFFFQAEDGIRDGHVTGVQTCALPISTFLPLSSGTNPARQAANGAAPAPSTTAFSNSIRRSTANARSRSRTSTVRATRARES